MILLFSEGERMGGAAEKSSLSKSEVEAAIGVEPMNKGFADLCLSHLATPPRF
jgi:hypothetical protein